MAQYHGKGGGGKVLPSNIDSSYSPAGSILVAGAGTAAANAVYYIAGVQDGKSYYINDTTDYGIYWIPPAGENNGYWDIEDDTLTSLYTSEEDVLTPDLVESGWSASGGAEPLPTVTAYTNYPAGYTLQADGSGAGTFVLPTQFAYDSATLVDDAGGNVSINLFKDGVELTTGTFLINLFFTDSNGYLVDNSVAGPAIPAGNYIKALVSDFALGNYGYYIFLWIGGTFEVFSNGTITGTCYANMVLPTGAVVTSNALSNIPPP